jgi:hypothetical protein
VCGTRPGVLSHKSRGWRQTRSLVASSTHRRVRDSIRLITNLTRRNTVQHSFCSPFWYTREDPDCLAMVRPIDHILVDLAMQAQLRIWSISHKIEDAHVKYTWLTTDCCSAGSHLLMVWRQVAATVYEAWSQNQTCRTICLIDVSGHILRTRSWTAATAARSVRQDRNYVLKCFVACFMHLL